MEFELRHNALLKHYTTLQIGGVADYLAVVKTEDELRAALRFAKANTATPPLILGGGSNVLCSDDGYRGLVIVNKIHDYQVVSKSDTSVLLQVGAGEVFDDVVKRTIDDNFWGLENLSAIPGSVGATPIQNVGAYGVEIASLIESVTAINTTTLENRTFTSADCTFGYRDSFFKTPAGKNWCVTMVVYALSAKPRPVLTYKDVQPLQSQSSLTQQQIRGHIISVRSKKFPNWQKIGTAGSFFKNPIIPTKQYLSLQETYPDLPGFAVSDNETKVSLGWILDKVCNLRGYQEGNVSLYEKQALVLVAHTNATSIEVESFVQEIKNKVHALTKIEIEREVLSV